MVLKRFRCRHETLLLVQKDASAAEEASHCTVLDDSSGNSSQSTHGAVKGAMESKDGSLMAPEAAIDVRRNNSSEARKVSFDYVLVKEFDRIIGDNPSCSFGVPISIGWILENESEIEMDEYETFRQTNRRSKLQLIMPKQTREDMLMEWGCSTEEISRAVKEKMKIQNQRNCTVAKLGTLDSLEELLEKANRKMRKTFRRK